jgi:hypothetical protein
MARPQAVSASHTPMIERPFRNRLRLPSMDVLQLDVSGRPQAWIAPREAAVLYAIDAIAWTLGDTFQVLRGGTQRSTGLVSRIALHPIVAVRGSMPSRAWRTAPGLLQVTGKGSQYRLWPMRR